VINPIQGFTFDYNTYVLSHNIKLLCSFIDNQMMNSFSIARTIPEFDEVVDTLLKKGSEILSYSNKLDLIMMRQ